MRAVVVGCGAVSNRWLESAAKLGVDIVALVDVDVNRARQKAIEYGLNEAIASDDLDATLRTAQPDIVFDLVQTPARHAVASRALAANCHVLSEKPLAANMEEAKDLLARAQVADKLHMITQNKRHTPQARQIKRFLDSNSLGRLMDIHCDFFIGTHWGGYREQIDHVMLLDLSFHLFDLARYFAGVDAIGALSKEWNPSNSWYKHGASATVTFDFAGGCVFSYRASCCAEGFSTGMGGNWRFVCEQGTLVWDGAADIAAECAGTRTGLFSEMKNIEIPPASPDDGIEGHLSVMREFLQAVKTGSTPETVSSENIKSFAMAFAAVESAESGVYAYLVN